MKTPITHAEWMELGRWLEGPDLLASHAAHIRLAEILGEEDPGYLDMGRVELIDEPNVK